MSRRLAVQLPRLRQPRRQALSREPRAHTEQRLQLMRPLTMEDSVAPHGPADAALQTPEALRPRPVRSEATFGCVGRGSWDSRSAGPPLCLPHWHSMLPLGAASKAGCAPLI
jgi:hypothetical protein